MEWYEIVVDGGRTVKFPTRSLLPVIPRQQLHQQQQRQQQQLNTSDCVDDYAVTRASGGVIKRGEWAWLANGATLQIVALRNGQSVSVYEFAESRGYDNCCIRCVEELFPYNTETVLLAVCLESFHAPGGGYSYVALYSVEHSKVLCCMEMQLHISAAAFISTNCCRRSLLQNFDGCLAVGSEEGVVVLLDLNMRKVMALQIEQMHTDRLTTCQIVDYNLPLAEIHRNFQQCRQDGLHFGLQLEVIDTPCAIQSLLPIDLILGLSIGLEDGRLAFYDLAEMQIFYIALPGPHESMAPVAKMCYLEPLDDPRHCLYVWAMHENGENLNAVLHTLIYEKRMREKDGFYYFEAFVTSTVRLNLPLETSKSVAVGCQAISRITTNPNTLHLDEDANCLCALAWHSVLEDKNKLLIFDLNQWYKEEMPYALSNHKNPSYLAGYILSGRQCALNAYLNPATIANFNSLQRFEEHFYPNSLSFDCMLLLEDGCRSYTWIGAQNRLINMLRSSNAGIFLEPEAYFKEIIRTRLLPQFLELNVDSTFSRNAKYDTILSVALEHNCFSLLRDCARSWADGSFMGGNFASATGISLSTLTEWLWKRATDIKARCNDLSKGLFDYNGYPLDQREQKELGFMTRQLKLLADLLSEVLISAKRHIPENVFTNLETRYKSLRMASEYQEVLMWLLNIGLLPEAATPRYNYSYSSKSNPNNNNIVYPYIELKKLYTEKRDFFGSLSENFISKKTGSCRLLFIDAFIEHECKGDVLRESWLENGGNGLYPPTSIEAMLRVMLVPEMAFETKCAMLLYFFLDLHMTIDEQAHKEVVASFVKFPSVFMLTAPLIKTVQAFWNLDHGNFVPAVDEFISPFNNQQTYSQWMLELLIDALLTQNASQLALRILETRSTLISPVLKLNTLLSNGLISEAFHFARSKNDETLLELFFKCCLCAGKYSVIRDLALNEKEGQLVQRILKRSNTHGAENLHFVYLLQKSKYIEAVSYLDELSRSKSLRTQYGGDSATDTPNLVLSAFNTTMAPVTQGLTDVYFRIKNKIKKKEADNKSPVPLSCQLIKQNANNLLGGIYHSSALSAHFATYYWGEMESMNRDTPATNLLSSNNAPFLRKPQAEAYYLDNTEQSSVSYPQPYKLCEKRTLAEVELQDTNDALERQQSLARQNPKKRRRLLGQEIVDDLSHFLEINKNSSRLNASGFNLTAKATDRAETPRNDNITATIVETPRRAESSSISFLTQPVTPRRRLATEPENNSSRVQSVTELHGILKTNTPERTERANSIRRELGMDEGKNLRFKLPVSELAKEVSTEECAANAVAQEELTQGGAKRRITTTTTTVVDEANDDDEDAFEVIVELKDESPQPKAEKRVSVTRSISVDSNSNDTAESIAQSEDEDFYSPLSSRNTSLVVDNARSPIAAATAAAAAATSTSTSQVSTPERKSIFAERFPFLSAPQARKPLARYSAERSEKSLSPAPTNMLPDVVVHVEQQATNKFGLQQQTSGGYDSLVTKACVTARPALQITSVISLSSAINEFTPQSSSSKICETQSKFVPDIMQKQRYKISEHTTIVGAPSSMEMELNNKTSHTYAELETTAIANEDAEQQKVEDTTLDMSAFDDTTGHESSKAALLAAKSTMLIAEMDAAEDAAEVAQETSIEVEAEISVYEDTEATENVSASAAVDNALMDEALGIHTIDDPLTTVPAAENIYNDDENSNEVEMYYHEMQMKTVRTIADADVDKNDVIVLSSSSSSSSNASVESADNAALKRMPFGRRISADTESDEEEEEEDDGVEDEEEDDDDEDGGDTYAEEIEDDDNDYNDEQESTVDEVVDSVNVDDEEDDDDVVAVEGEWSNEPEQVANKLNEIEKQDDVVKKQSDSISAKPTVSAVNPAGNIGEGNNSGLAKPTTTAESDIPPTVESSDSSYDGISVQFESTEVLIEEMFDESSTSDEELQMNQTVTFEEDHIRVKSLIDDVREDGGHVIKQGSEEIVIQELKVETQIAEGVQVYGEAFYYVTEESCEKFIYSDVSGMEISQAEVMENISKTEAQTIHILETLPEQLMQDDDVDGDVEPVPEIVKETKQTAEADSIAHAEKDLVVNIMTEEHTVAVSNVQESVEVPQNVEANSVVETGANAESSTVVEETAGVVEEEEQINLRVDEDELSDGGSEKATDLVMVKNNSPNVIQQIEETQGNKEKSVNKVEPQPDSGADEIATTSKSSTKAIEKQEKQQVAEEGALDLTPRRRTKSITKTLEEADEILSASPLHNRHSLRGNSVPPVESDAVGSASTPRRNTRGISVPPQGRSELDDAAATAHTPRAPQRRMRASSQQPQSLLDTEEHSSATGTPRTRRSLRGSSVPHDTAEAGESAVTPVRHGRGTSVPPAGAAAAVKITTRRRSALLDAINEHASTPVTLDSPSTRTRLRTRLNSMESELDGSIVSGGDQQPQPKRTRRTSLSSNVSEQQAHTPKRTRRTSAATSQAESTSTPRPVRRSSRLNSEISPNSTTPPETGAAVTDEKTSESPQSEEVGASPTSSMLYSSARRLTRTQLAVLERAATMHKQTAESLATHISPPTSRRVSKRRSSRSTVHDSDEIESISSHLSNVSQPSKRRVTRSSVKDKDELDDDITSIASSMGSERPSKRRSKDSKTSPNTTLSTIQEDEAEEETEQKKRGRPSKKRNT